MGQKIVVIGAGLIGMSIGAQLAQAGQDVTILSADQPGGGTSMASFAWYNALIKFPVAYLEMNVNGMRALERYAARHSSAPWLHPGGSLEISVGEEGLERQVRIYNEMSAHGYKARWISIDELLALEPALDRAALKGGKATYYPDEGYVDAVGLVAQFMLDARSAGAVIRPLSEVVGFDVSGGRITAARLADGTRQEGDLFVNAGGPSADRLAAAAGCHLPMSNTLGVQVYTRPSAPGAMVQRVIHAPNLSVRPDGGGRLCLHDHSVDAKVTRLAQGDAARADGYAFDKNDAKPMVDRLVRFFPSLADTPLEAARIGIRPIPADKMPVVGRFSECENFYAAVMHSGVTQSVWVGELVTREIVKDAPQDALASFRPQRFALTKEVAV